jgi:hypothetical protein
MSKEAMKLALEELIGAIEAARTDVAHYAALDFDMCEDALQRGYAALEALAKQKQGEPVADRFELYHHIVLKLAEAGCKLSEQQKMVLCNLKAVTAPQQRTWVGLDPEEIRKTNHHMVDGAYHYSFKQGAEWAEAKLKEKNT